jgi:hypothetical protein
MCKALIDRYRCPEQFVRTSLTGSLSAESGFFRFGRDLLCYGRPCGATPAASAGDRLPDLLDEVRTDHPDVQLPFDLTQLVDNLTYERYLTNAHGTSPGNSPNPLLSKLYYAVRPLLSASLRIPLQRMYLRGWEKIAFPAWPLDLTVENLLETVLLLCMKSSGIDAVPFIWFWPDGAPSAAILTHDVETAQGRDFCSRLMDIDESFGFRSSFQIVPEERYPVTAAFLKEIRDRGHEINVQDLNHDGNLFRDRREFLHRVKAINEYGRVWGAKGFRSAILYRNLNWYDALAFEYDMSVPNTGRLEPQHGGCCTAFPYFIGDILEIPVTTTQDYSLFHILREHRIDLWKTQTGVVMDRHGLLSLLSHPDYLLDHRAQGVYRALLVFLSELESEHKMWIALPNQVNEWWRQRSKMTLAPHGSSWRIEGPGKERARLAYARRDGDRLIYTREASVPGTSWAPQPGRDLSMLPDLLGRLAP